MKKYTALFILLFLCSCGNQSEAPIEVAHRMKTLACMGDVEGFYSYIDSLSVERNYEVVATDLIRENGGSSPQSIKEFQDIVIPSLIVLKWEVISKELANGKDGAFCNMQLINNPDDEYTVGIIFPDGKTSAWNFEDRSGQMMVASIFDQIPFDFAELDLGLRSKHENSVQTRNELSDNEEKENAGTVGSNSQDDDEKKTTDPKVVPPTVKEDKEMVVAKNEDIHQVDEAPKEDNKKEKTSTQAISRPGYDFGTARWGMTKNQVIASERSNPVSEASNILVYNGANAQLDYVFSGGKLVSGRYVKGGSSGDGQVFIRNYESMKKRFTNRYGKPQEDEEIWTNSIYKDNPDRYGFAVYIGHLRYRTTWISARSNIILELKSNNYDMLLEASYRSR